jgi:hypothetical protein
VSTPRRKSRKETGKYPATRRRVAVLVSLVAVLTFTSALLLALAPAPLNPQASSSLFAIDAPQSFDVLFDNPVVPIPAARWQYIYIHHSSTVSGSAQTLAESALGLADHFVLGNGDGCADGEIQVGQRWTQQVAADRTPGTDSIRPDCISICLIGDFNQSRPTATQQRRLVQLVSALQGRLHIPRSHLFFDSHPANAAGIGRYFRSDEFLQGILP